MEKYYVWYGLDRNDNGYNSFEFALQEAMSNGDVTEIEKTIWNSEEDYQNYEPADSFETVWKRN